MDWLPAPGHAISAFGSLEQRMDILTQANYGIRPHCFVSLSVKVLFDPRYDLTSNPGFARGLKQRKVIQLVIFVIDDRESRDSWMFGEPF
jgi:hypothetical protein